MGAMRSLCSASYDVAYCRDDPRRNPPQVMKQAPDIRALLTAWAETIDDKKVAVLLSGGVDSAALVFALQEAGKQVTAYTFTLEGRVSTDFSRARKLCDAFAVEFVPVFLPRCLETLLTDLKQLKRIGAKKKTDFECGWPMLYAYAAAKEKTVASGMGADGHFCISKKGMIHYRSRIDEFRIGLYRNTTYAQQHIHKRLAEQYNKRCELPFLQGQMQTAFLGTTWEQVNKPRQKQSILSAFPSQFARVGALPHTNLQLGDSGIAEHFAALLKTNANTKGHKSVVGIYNNL